MPRGAWVSLIIVKLEKEPFVEALCTSSNTLLVSTSSAVKYTPLVDATAVTLACE